MRSLVIPDGGMPFEGGDLEWLQSGMRDAIRGLARPFLQPGGKAILANSSPLTVTDTSMTFKNSWIVLNGDLLEVSNWTQSGANEADYGIFKKADYFDPAGQDVFDDGLTKDTYRIQEAEILLLTAGTGDHIKLSEIDDYLPKFLTNQSETVLDEPGNKIEVMKQGNVITMQGFFDTTILNVELSTIYRPNDDITCMAFTADGIPIGVEIRQTGEIVALAPIPDDSETFHFNLTYFV